MNSPRDVLDQAQDGRPAPPVWRVATVPSVETPGAGPLGPIRATRDGADSDAVRLAEHGFGDRRRSEAPGEWGLAPTHATREGADTDTVSPAANGIDEPPVSVTPQGRTRRGFDPRALPPRRGVARAVGITLSFLAVVGAGTGTGYLFWKSELARPELVRHLPAMPAAVADLTPVRDANATTGVAGEAVAGTAIRPEVGLGSPDPAAVEAAALDPLRSRGFASAAWDAEAAAMHGVARASVSEGTDEVRLAVAAGSLTRGGTDGPREAAAVALSVPDSSLASREPGGFALDGSESSRVSPVAGTSFPADWTGARPAPSAAEPAIPSATDTSHSTIDHSEPATNVVEADSGRAPGAGIAIRKRVRADHVAALLERGYEMFHSGDAESAGQAYGAVLVYEPRNRDALLGLAAVVSREDRWEEAAGYYARVLATNPADTVARAALLAIDKRDPVHRESRLKALLWSEPRAAYLHFSLGNVYAEQSRWSQAQQSYFNAYRFDNGNADYAYNLAVSLDHLSRRESALDFYREAFVLARSRPGSFETAAVLARVRDLERSSDEDDPSARPLSAPAGAALPASAQ